MIRKYDEQIYTNILCKLVEIDKFLRHHLENIEYLCEGKLDNDLLDVDIKSSH